MKQRISYLLLISILGISTQVQSQSSLERGINYQAVARNIDGTAKANQQLQVRVGLVEPSVLGKVFYSELHSLQTDDQGYFQLEIGKGKVINGTWEEVPWATEQIWLNVELSEVSKEEFRIINRTPFQTVPYAFNAKTAKRIEQNNEIDLRENFSIFWNTSGNYKTERNVHFVGTRDAKDFYIKTNNRTRMDFGKAGELNIYADSVRRSPPGPPNYLDLNYYVYALLNDEELIDAYALHVRGKEHGIYIEVNESRSNATNFVTFHDNEKIHGNIEGYTIKELTSSQDWIIEEALFAVDLALAISVTIAEYAQAVGFAGAAGAAGASLVLAWKAPGFSAASGGTFALGAAASADVVLKLAEKLTKDQNAFETIGVSFSSGAADYAEYLKRAPSERNLFPGEVVGVRNGEVSLNTKDADHVMVISEHPAFLGNMPTPEKVDLFNKVAFMGQVKVKVIGPVKKGDYLLPSGNHDGLAVAIAEEDLPTADFKEIIGVAWEGVDTEEKEVNIINISVGLNKNDLAPRVEQVAGKLDNIIAYLKGEEDLKDKDVQASEIKNNYTKWDLKDVSNIDEEQLDHLLSKVAPTIEQYFDLLEFKMQSQGIQLRDYEAWKALLDNPIQEIKALQKDPKHADKWRYLFQKYQEGK